MHKAHRLVLISIFLAFSQLQDHSVARWTYLWKDGQAF